MEMPKQDSPTTATLVYVILRHDFTTERHVVDCAVVEVHQDLETATDEVKRLNNEALGHNKEHGGPHHSVFTYQTTRLIPAKGL